MKIYNWRDVEQSTNITKHRIKYALERGRLGGFTKVNGAFVFTDADLVRITEHFAWMKPWQRDKMIETNSKRKVCEI